MPDHVHRWMRYVPAGGGTANHWCIDGDTIHHPEPCADADAKTGEHANDVTDQGDWPVLSF